MLLILTFGLIYEYLHMLQMTDGGWEVQDGQFPLNQLRGPMPLLTTGKEFDL
jgi:hypothetical protein